MHEGKRAGVRSTRAAASASERMAATLAAMVATVFMVKLSSDRKENKVVKKGSSCKRMQD